MSDIKADFKEMQKAYAEYTELQHRIRSLEARREEVRAFLPTQTAKIEEAKKQKQKVIADHVAGLVGQDAVAEARSLVDAAQQDVKNAEEILLAIQTEHQKAVAGLYTARANCRDARRRYCQACVKPIEDQLAADPKIRRQLLDIFAAAALRDDPELGFGQGMVDWQALLTNTFPEPTGDEIDKAIERFERNHMQDSKEVAA